MWDYLIQEAAYNQTSHNKYEISNRIQFGAKLTVDVRLSCNSTINHIREAAYQIQCIKLR